MLAYCILKNSKITNQSGLTGISQSKVDFNQKEGILLTLNKVINFSDHPYTV